jgi:alpha-beta hydrolase superfamily lysophospholipase
VKAAVVGLGGLGLGLLLVLHAPPAFAAGRPITLSSSGGVTIAGEYFEAATRPAPSVLLVHMLSRNKGDWGSLPDRIRDAGINALTIDLRGHGQSTGSAQDLPEMVQDVRAAAQWLLTRPNARGDSIAIVGASLGASLALLAAVAVPQVRALGLMSPSLDYRGLRTDVGLVKRLGARSIWLAASAEDPLALRTQRDIAAEPSGPREQHVSSAVAHGTVLLDRDPEVARSLVDWLRRSLLS